MKMSNYTLGLDMGVASLGWACVSEEDETIDAGVRIFPAGIDKFGTGKDTHLNQKRRKARGARRRFSRKAKRKKLIRSILSQLGWLPSDAKELQQWENLDPYEIRHRAISEKISISEFSRIILHLNQLRGFLSLRKSEVDAAEGEDKKKLEGLLGEISRLETEIQKSGHRTLGNFLYHLRAKHGGEHGNEIRLRARHIRRQMLHHEFCLIWEEQSQHHPELTDALRYGTHGAQKDPVAVTRPVAREKDQSLLEQFGLENLTFFQRRVYWPMSSIGHCELEKAELRAPVADRRFQEFRMLQELNNLRILDQSLDKPQERPLTETERETALAYLSATQKPTLKGLKKKIARLSDSPEEKQMTFNLEADKRDNIGGLQTDLKLSKAVGAAAWKTFPEETKNRIVEILTLPEQGAKKVIQRTDDETRALLQQIDGLSADHNERLLKIALPSGYCGLSIKALERLLPHMRKGCLYQGKKGEDDKSARHLAGYPRRDEESSRVLDQLPLLSNLTDPRHEHHDRHFPLVNNPLVLRSLTELRKVVNAIVRKHGKPSAIHLEMARDLKMSAKQREIHAKKNNEHKKARELAAKKLEENGIAPTRDAIQLYRLWQEQGEQCIYSGNSISFRQLVSGEVDIDHIYPRRANDDSYMNKVVCFREENVTKGDRLPADWLGVDSQAFEDLSQRAKDLPYPKRKRLLAEKIPEDFAARDAVDTAYMTRVARHYLSLLVDDPSKIFCIKGKHTSFLRKQWELNHLLRNDLLDLKNRDDHRHHALDAIVIACCGRSLVQKISRELHHKNTWKEKTDDDTGKPIRIYLLKSNAPNLDAPWDGFAQAAETSLNSIWVSHRPQRKLSGPLHEETNYGATDQPGVLVRRKNLSSLTEGEIGNIRDEAISKIVLQYLEQEKVLYPEDFGKKVPKELTEHFKENHSLTEEDIAYLDDDHLRKTLLTKLQKKNPLKDADLGKITLPNNKGGKPVPIKKVRLLKKDATMVALRPATYPKEYAKPGNTHHVSIFSLGEGKHHLLPVTLLEVSRLLSENKKRKKQNLSDVSLVRKSYSNMPPEAEYRFHLCSGDSMMATIDGKDRLFIVRKMSSINGRTHLILHTDARDSKNRKLFDFSPGSFEKKFPNARKVTILPNGEIKNCN